MAKTDAENASLRKLLAGDTGINEIPPEIEQQLQRNKSSLEGGGTVFGCGGMLLAVFLVLKMAPIPLAVALLILAPTVGFISVAIARPRRENSILRRAAEERRLLDDHKVVDRLPS